jgi:hypothetical protein
MADTLAGQLEGLYELRLLFDSRDPRHVRRAALIHALDVWHQVELIDLSAARPGGALGPDSASEAVQLAADPLSRDAGNVCRLRLVTRRGQVLSGYALFERLVRRLRLLWPLALLTWLPGAGRLGRSWYPGEPQDSPPSGRKAGMAQTEAATKNSDPIQARGPARG